MYRNGVLVQGLTSPTEYIKLKGKAYLGVNAFHTDPLFASSDAASRDLSDEASFKRVDGNHFQPLSFITNTDLLSRYLSKCKERGIPARVLFVESSYSEEKLDGASPEMNFIGYEYCEIPFDCQVITDFDWYEPLARFKERLNEYGLFDTLEDALEFKACYDDEFKKGSIGDGEMDTFICKIHEVNTDCYIN